MKKALTYLSIIFFQFGSATLLLAKEDSVKTELASQDSITHYISPTEYAFMMHEETNWLVKVGLPEFLYFNGPNFGAFTTSLAAEFRIAPSLTIDTRLYYYIGGSNANSNSYSTRGIRTAFQLRWYYKMKKLSKINGTSKNMSGNYFLLNMAYQNTKAKNSWDSTPSSLSTIEYFSFQVGWGLQRRFLKNGYFSIGLGTGINVPISSDENVSFTLGTKMSVGLAFTKDKYVLNRDQLCTIIRCYESSSFVLKSNFYNIINLEIDAERRVVYFNPNIIAEKKLGKSPFSLQAGLAINYHYEYGAITFSSNGNNLKREGSQLGFNALLETRWYYNLKKRILKGKTGNGLAANYFGIGADFNFYKAIGNFNISRVNNQYYYLNTGIQRFFSDHFYFDYALSFGYLISEYNKLDTWGDLKGFQVRTVLAVGYRF